MEEYIRSIFLVLAMLYVMEKLGLVAGYFHNKFKNRKCYTREEKKYLCRFGTVFYFVPRDEWEEISVSRKNNGISKDVVCLRDEDYIDYMRIKSSLVNN